MDIQTRKIKFVREFLNLQNEELISRLEKLLYSKSKSSENDFKRMTMDEFNRRIDKSMSDSKNGKLTMASDLISEIQEWK